MKDNKLIAEFMGGYTPYEKFGDNTEYYYKGKYVKLENMEFHKSWDWLMPVVQKCFDTQQPEEGQHYFINESLLTMDIGVVYDRVVEFIKTYNDER